MLSTASSLQRLSSACASPRTATRPKDARVSKSILPLALLKTGSAISQCDLTVRPQFEADGRHSACSRSTTRCGAIIPFVGFLPGPFVLACVMWTLGAIRFWRRFDRTTYMRQSRLALTALWPVLFIGSPKFRSEFKKAVASARDGMS